MNLPNFLIVGAPKCGTTSLYYLLKEHPSVYMPLKKEPYYLIKPRDIIGEGPGTLGKGLVDNFNDYKKLFEGIDMSKIKA